MRPLDPHAAPPKAGAEFWDHLARTRAQEYAADEALARLPMDPVRPEPARAELAWPDAVQPLPHAPAPPSGPAPEPRRSLLAGRDAPAGPKGADWPAPAPSDVPHLSFDRPAPNLSRRATGRLAYRMQRIWLTPLYRRALTVGLPIALTFALVAGYLAQPEHRAALNARWQALYALVVDRPEFLVSELRIAPVAPEIEAAIRAVIEPELPKSSFRLDLVALRAELERIDAIRLADLRLSAEGALSVTITERVPAILWRSAEGLEVLDAEGVRIGFVTDRQALPGLMLIAGEGANRRVGEALDLIEAAAPFGERMLGLVHLGERRWDVVLDRDQVIRLPETGAVAALERIIAYDQAQDLLARDVLSADMRDPARLVVQVSDGALETIRALRGDLMSERRVQ